MYISKNVLPLHYGRYNRCKQVETLAQPKAFYQGLSYF